MSSVFAGIDGRLSSDVGDVITVLVIREASRSGEHLDLLVLEVGCFNEALVVDSSPILRDRGLHTVFHEVRHLVHAKFAGVHSM